MAGRGIVYVFAGGFTSANNVNASDAAFRIIGAPGDRLGTSLASADFNNDGHRDLVVGAAGTGRVYVINGAAGLSGTLDLSNPATPPNVTIAGFRRGDVIAAADVTGDGIPDLLAGSADRNMALLYIGRPSGGLPATPDATFAGVQAGD